MKKVVKVHVDNEFLRSSRNFIQILQKILSVLLCCWHAFKVTFGYDCRVGGTSAVQSLHLRCQTFRRVRFCHHKYNIVVEVSAFSYKNYCKLVCTAFFTSLFTVMYQLFVSESDVTLLAHGCPLIVS
jgi:hypothetical protein